MNKIKTPLNRNRIVYFALTIAVIVLGLGSRKFSTFLPEIVGEYAGDCLYALMAYFIIGFIKPKYSILKVGLSALIFSYLIEITQLFHAQWIDSIRNIRLGGLILGYGFLWSDIICYTVGVSIGIVFELIIFKTNLTNRPHFQSKT